jgi:hypothetical protein
MQDVGQFAPVSLSSVQGDHMLQVGQFAPLTFCSVQSVHM